ncbi:DUF6365 family protein [Abyssisolibacter fermentans]|uniref:DUF6365 family protein n=1 Tax=Abyssisolibacter fermentans TaxID=1766203 RepID=UPI00082F0F67|nr:DUF6365 family protein [Abyssisolibacter fermentans]
MKILTIIYPSTGIGESYTAVSFSKQMKSCGHEVIYIGHEMLKFILANSSDKIYYFKNNLMANKILFEKVIKKFEPHVVLFTDYHMYKRNQLIKIPFYFEWLKNTNAKTYIIDTIGNCYKKSVEGSIFGSDCLSLQVPNWVEKILRPVPLHDPIQNYVEYVSYCALKNRVSSAPTVDKILHKSTNDDSKIILFPIGNWIDKIGNINEKKSLKLIIDTILTYIDDLNIKAKVFTFGYWDYSFNFNNIEIDQSFSQLSIEETDYLIKKSNLVITINAISNMASRAIQSNVKVVTFVNSKSRTLESLKCECNISQKNKKRILEYFDDKFNEVSRYMIFPETAIEVLNKFYSVNKVTKSLMNIVEIFNEKEAAEILRSILIENDKNNSDLYSKYIESCRKLPCLSKIIEEKQNEKSY